MNFSDIKFPDILFVTGIGTDVGKSFVTGWLAREIIASGRSCITQKMIQTGNRDFSEDIVRHRQIMRTGYFPEDFSKLTAPEIFTYPASPDLAARIDGREINLSRIAAATEALREQYGCVLLEGAGGLMVPVHEEYLTADYIREHHLPVIVTVTGQLGSINHALLTFNALETYGINLFAAVYNPHFDKDETICEDTREYLRKWLCNHFPKALWLEMPEIECDEDNYSMLSISKTQLASLPPAHFEGEIQVVQSPEEIDDALAALRQNSVIGFDTETRPSFKKGQNNTVALIQLSTDSTCFLFRINKTGFDPRIIELLEDPAVIKIGLSTHDDFHNLNKITHVNPAGFIDLQNYVKKFRIADNSLSRIYGILFGERISKGQRLTNWEADTLTSSQQKYAALDAMACVQIYRYLESGEFNPAISPFKVKTPDVTSEHDENC